MKPGELKSKRHALGLTAEGFARMVRVQSGRTVRKWEAGDRDIPGPVIVILDLADAVPTARGWLLRGSENAKTRSGHS